MTQCTQQRPRHRSTYDPTMASSWWPIFDIRITTPDLALRPLAEADLAQLAAVLPADVEMDPSATVYDGLTVAHQRTLVLAQTYWKSFGTWRPESWAVQFGVFNEGELVGAQGLEADDFPILRTVDSSSFLVGAARGRGWGKQMRRAVLALAFDGLGSEYAVSSAWHENATSLGVSRSLGYQDNGVVRHRREGRTAASDVADEMVHLRLTRTQWMSHGGAAGITVDGLTPCLPLFGL